MEFIVQKLTQVGTVSSNGKSGMTPVEAAAKIAGRDFDESLGMDGSDTISTYEFAIEDIDFSVTFVSHNKVNEKIANAYPAN